MVLTAWVIVGVVIAITVPFAIWIFTVTPVWLEWVLVIVYIFVLTNAITYLIISGNREK